MTLHGSNGVHPLTKQSSFLSQVTLGWLSPLLKKSLSGSLDTADVWDVDEHQNVRRFLGETGDSKANFIDPGKPLPESILELLIDTYPRLMLGSAALEIGYLVLAILQPFLLQILIEKQSRPVVVATFVAGIFLGAFYYHSLFIVRLVGMRLRAAMTALVCDKGMVVPRNAGNSGVEPSVLNEVDLFNVFKMVEVVNELWVVPLHASLSIGALVYILGWQSILAGSIAAVCSCRAHLLMRLHPILSFPFPLSPLKYRRLFLQLLRNTATRRPGPDLGHQHYGPAPCQVHGGEG